eukprot:TRINITY_DN38778_c0_g1_i1.p1 TRINITY_DN38778_c0_g1~~TRINITY_DN38778_c0_g1_i1.p1  ORF type:complete len:116 (-),score=8.15 TRINITY_DN38778_c0_g1_i1:483-830(-)
MKETGDLDTTTQRIVAPDFFDCNDLQNRMWGGQISNKIGNMESRLPLYDFRRFAKCKFSSVARNPRQARLPNMPLWRCIPNQRRTPNMQSRACLWGPIGVSPLVDHYKTTRPSVI